MDTKIKRSVRTSTKEGRKTYPKVLSSQGNRKRRRVNELFLHKRWRTTGREERTRNEGRSKNERQERHMEKLSYDFYDSPLCNE